MVPKQRKPGQIGGKGHTQSRLLSARRRAGSSGKPPKKGCFSTLVGLTMAIILVITYLFS